MTPLILSLRTLTSNHGTFHVAKTLSSILTGQLKPVPKFKAALTQSLTDEVKTLGRLLDKEKV